MKNTKYETTVKLEHNEVAVALNVETGELKSFKKNKNNIPDGKELFDPGLFRKVYDETEEFLDKILTPLEFKVVAKLCRMAEPNTNSLCPLNDDTGINVLAEELGINRHTVPKLLKKLFELGVYAKFEVVIADKGYTKYWLLNPFIRFKGKLIESDIKRLFIGTVIHKEYIKSIENKKII